VCTVTRACRRYPRRACTHAPRRAASLRRCGRRRSGPLGATQRCVFRRIYSSLPRLPASIDTDAARIRVTPAFFPFLFKEIAARTTILPFHLATRQPPEKQELSNSKAENFLNTCDRIFFYLRSLAMMHLTFFSQLHRYLCEIVIKYLVFYLKKII